MKYKYKDKIFDYREDAETEAYKDADNTEMYDEYLDEVYGTFEIVGIKLYASEILKRTDPIAYSVCYNDFVDFCVQDNIEEIKDEEA